MSVLSQVAVTQSRRNIFLILAGCALMFAILQTGVTWLASLLDQTWAAIIGTTTMLVVALFFEHLFFKHGLPQSFLGLDTAVLVRARFWRQQLLSSSCSDPFLSSPSARERKSA